MDLKLVSIATNTCPLDGALYEPDGRETNGAILIMHGNSTDFYTGINRELPPLPTKLGFAEAFVERTGGPAEFPLMEDYDHFHGGREAAGVEIVARWFTRHGLDRPA